MWRIASGAIKGGSTMVSPAVDTDATFAVLANGGSYTSIVFTTTFMPLFDIYVASDVELSLQLQCAYQATGSGSTFRNVGNPFVVPAMAGAIPAFALTNYRVPNLLAKWVLTNNSGGAAALTEMVIINRSL